MPQLPLPPPGDLVDGHLPQVVEPLCLALLRGRERSSAPADATASASGRQTRHRPLDQQLAFHGRDRPDDRED
jgi:hypothetical protein